MQTKLTLRLEKALVEKAKLYAEQSGKSVSQMVADYFSTLDEDVSTELSDLPPLTRSLSGVLSKDVTEQDYYGYLETKHL